MRNRTVGRPPSRALTASARIQPSSSRPSRAPWTIRGSVRRATPARAMRRRFVFRARSVEAPMVKEVGRLGHRGAAADGARGAACGRAGASARPAGGRDARQVGLGGRAGQQVVVDLSGAHAGEAVERLEKSPPRAFAFFVALLARRGPSGCADSSARTHWTGPDRH